MSGNINCGFPPRFASREQFLRWVRDLSYPGSLEDYRKLYGKPIVRVPVERQTPNEADL